MNVGVGSYLHTRIAVHLSQILSERGELKLAEQCLKSAARLNPYNAQLWMALKKVQTSLVSSRDDTALMRAETLSLMATLVSNSSDFPPVDTSYLKVLSRQFLPITPTSSKEKNRKILHLLQASQKAGLDVMPTLVQFQVSVNGWRYYQASIKSTVNGFNVKKFSRSKKLEVPRRYQLELSAISKDENDSKNKIQWLTSLLDKSSENKWLIRKKKEKLILRPQGYYQCLHRALVDSLQLAGEEEKAQQIEASLEKERQALREAYQKKK